eukprot:5767238-Alexandrium_andersonii.AAC.1
MCIRDSFFASAYTSYNCRWVSAERNSGLPAATPRSLRQTARPASGTSPAGHRACPPRPKAWP